MNTTAIDSITLIPLHKSGEVLCCHVNTTDTLQVARISNIPGWYLERTVFPKQEILFKAPLSALLEIHSCKLIGAILSDKIPCNRLIVKESP